MPAAQHRRGDCYVVAQARLVGDQPVTALSWRSPAAVLKVVAEAVLSGKALSADPVMAQRVIDTIMLGLDRQRFPRVSEDRAPTETERAVAITGTAALVATRRVMTARANEAKGQQEQRVKDALIQAGFAEVPTREISTLHQAPGVGEFCGESGSS